MSFWDIVWFIFISFAFVAYLMVMFSIVGDLFRDREASGWVKAVWIIFLIVLPLITSLIYLIARGQGMSERSMQSAVEMRKQQDAYIRAVAGSSADGSSADGFSATQQIAQAKAMLENGTITQSEFEALKAKALV